MLTEKQTKYKTRLNKMLYNAARELAPEYSKNDTEAVKTIRDSATLDIYGKHYTDLSINQIQFVIKKLKSEAQRDKNHITKNQKRMLKNFQIMCALIYCKFDDVTFVDEATGEVHSGDAARELARKNYESDRLIPAAILRHMHTNWINPKSNQFMLEMNLKRTVRMPDRFYVEYLTQHQASRLIGRFQQIYQQASYKIQPIMPEVN